MAKITQAKREAWLARLTDRLRPYFAKHGYTIPEKVRVSCGWPSRGGLAPQRRVGGQCWYADSSSDNTAEIFISPTIDDKMDVAHILAHELVHATLGPGFGHGPTFRKCATAIGLEGPMRSTVAGDAFKRAVQPMLNRMGDYGHASLGSKTEVAGAPKKQTARLIKVKCATCDYTVRITRKWLDNPGPPICPTHNKTMVEEQ
tara:strand:- start:306 stop:911 length:606 start_codon:yes stop_codon:yes gene_type:complete